MISLRFLIKSMGFALNIWRWSRGSCGHNPAMFAIDNSGIQSWDRNIFISRRNRRLVLITNKQGEMYMDKQVRREQLQGRNIRDLKLVA